MARCAFFFLFVTIISSTCQNGTCLVKPSNAPLSSLDSGFVFKIIGLQFPSNSPSPSAAIGPTPCSETIWLSNELSCKISLPSVRSWMNSGIGSYWPYDYTNSTVTIFDAKNGSTLTTLYDKISFDAPVPTGVGSFSNMRDSETAWHQSGLDVFGPCSSYAPGGMNYGWCYWDFACGICRLSCWRECSYVFLGNG